MSSRTASQDSVSDGAQIRSLFDALKSPWLSSPALPTRISEVKGVLSRNRRANQTARSGYCAIQEDINHRPNAIAIRLVNNARKRAAPTSWERFAGLLRSWKVSALGIPNVSTFARNTGQ